MYVLFSIVWLIDHLLPLPRLHQRRILLLVLFSHLVRWLWRSSADSFFGPIQPEPAPTPRASLVDDRAISGASANAFKMGRWISRECLPSQLQTSEEILKDLVKTAKSDNTYKHECSESRRMT
ncbi:uncharacterized protein LOC127879708 [Dreissena polymorpha]|uniref:uncharacterized protein LOC127879708 n=1 Tax=Dreissena polymorpha TaxID=45954 RepID=UPI002263FEC6|nr:uncharacterized protein LOC127879708 [Dreissena polymorpha]